jgi:hypothetical protein
MAGSATVLCGRQEITRKVTMGKEGQLTLARVARAGNTEARLFVCAINERQVNSMQLQPLGSGILFGAGAVPSVGARPVGR